MRPLRLSMQAFGAYASKETIDFTELGAERIFVISGKTGSGKSTIFDAISFAIFGRANTNDREGFSLRSHFAKAEDLTEVTLEFLLRDVRYLVRRLPQQDVPKQRGEGFTTVTAKAELYELDGEQEKLLATSVRDVGAKMEEIIQLNVDQFRQILMIPQGEFRELLVAESKEKEAILQRLAHTHFYQLIENQLWDRQKELEQRVRLLREKVAGITLGAFDEEALVGKTTGDLEMMFSERIKAERETGAAMQIQVDLAKQKAEIAAKNVTLAEGRLAEWAELAQLRAEKETLTEQFSQCNQEKHVVDLARKAGAIIDQDALCLRLKQQLDEAKQEQQRALEALQESEERLTQAVLEMGQIKEVEPSYVAWIKEREQLQAMEVKVTRALGLQQDMARDREQKQALEEKLGLLQAQEKDCLARSEYLVEQVRLVHETRVRHAEVKQEHGEWKQREAVLLSEIDNWEQKAVLQAELVQLEIDSEVVEKASREAEIRSAELDAKWQKEQAAMLAATLVDGEACPVCGALDHPKIATQSAIVTKQEVDAARAMKIAKADVLKTIAMQVEQKRWQIEQIPISTEESLTGLKAKQLECSRVLTEKEQERLKMEAFFEETRDIEDQMARNKQQQTELAVLKGKQQEALEVVRKAVDTAATTYTLLLEDVPEAFQDTAQFYKQQETLTAQIAAFEARKKSVEAEHNSAKEQQYKAVSTKEVTEKATEKSEMALATQRTIFKEIMVANGFADYPTYRQAILTAEILEEKERWIRDFEQQYHFVSERLKAMEARLAESKKPDILVLQQLDREAKQEYHEKAEQWMAQKETIRKITALSEQFLAYLGETSEAEKAYADVGYLADMARGKNERRLTFERFVLATFLDTILLRANGRLKKMTNGRFQLIRKKEKSKGNVQSGLELEVYDEYTGLERHVKTLSGGESFKTSLALALALAEVVQEMSGGISLETMFIDEGFGTLDPESLEMAVECLLETQESGRLVGIISHVPELKERISTRLEVTATNHGSTTKFFTQEQ
ncbi:AAA family ATPase [Listeria grandensis]|uniref:AAA family ATPase n=1 Tax=Listeria grandensis TaxID=1494963 RepID=UPI00164DC9AF|nr:SMC family ATPase [Listeria grandensis]MBC6314665.1 SMC family ATPase [Listeria grandensis]